MQVFLGRTTTSGGKGNDRVLEVAHEAVFEAWPPLKQWLNDSREFLLWQRRLRADVAEWKRTNQDAGALLRGMRLREAERWLAERPSDVRDDEREYIVISREKTPPLRIQIRRRSCR